MSPQPSVHSNENTTFHPSSENHFHLQDLHETNDLGPSNMETIQAINGIRYKINDIKSNLQQIQLRLFKSEERNRILMQRILQQAENYSPTPKGQEDDIYSFT